jgi:hypothetical protein
MLATTLPANEKSKGIQLEIVNEFSSSFGVRRSVRQGGVAEERGHRLVEVLGAPLLPGCDARAETLGDEQQPHLIDGGLDCGELGEDLAALGVVLQHPLDATELPLGPA